MQMDKGNPPPYDPYGGMGPPPPQAFQAGGGPPPMNPHPGQQQPYPPHSYGGGGTSVIINPGMSGNQPVVTTTPVVYVGGCPTCRVGVMQESYGCCAIFLAIFFFPIGILCCLAMREKRCSNCGATFG